jgi:hypothetical protein
MMLLMLQAVLELFSDTPVIHADDDEEESDPLEVGSQEALTMMRGDIRLPRLTGGTRRRISSQSVDDSSGVGTMRSRPTDSAFLEERVIKIPKVMVPDTTTSTTPTTPVHSSQQDSVTPSELVVSVEDQVPPEGWIKAFSNKQQKTYWYNVTTKLSVWEFPTNK